MTQRYTTISQSQELIALGIDPNTADGARYEDGSCSAERYEEAKKSVDEVNEHRKRDGYPYMVELYPAWSLEALLEFLPPGTVFISNYRTARAEFCGERVKEKYNVEGKPGTIFESVFDMVKSLIKEGYINKRNNQ